MTKLEHLFQPLRIGDLELPNRLVMASLTTNFDVEQQKQF